MSTDIKVVTYNKIKALEDAVIGLHPHAAHSASSLLLWRILREMVQVLQARLHAVGGESGHEIRLVKRYGEIADYLHYLLGFLEAGEAARIPSVIISPLQALIQEQAPDAKLVVWSDWEPSNYSAHLGLGTDLRDIVTQLFDDPQHWVVRELPSVLAVLSFPAAERNNILLHSALGHEVGHVLVDHYSDIEGYKQFSRVRLDDKALRKIAEDFTEKAKAGFGDAADMGTLLTEIAFRDFDAAAVRILGSWLCELLADAYAVYLLGPAPVLSLFELAASDPPSDDHPPAYLRFPVMLECLKVSGFWRNDDARLNWLSPQLRAIESTCSQISLTGNPLYQVVFDCLHGHIAGIAGYIMNPVLRGIQEPVAPPYRYQDWAGLTVSAEGDSVSGNRLVDRILYHVIPDCIDHPGMEAVPASLPSVLNAGWAVYLDEDWWSRFCSGLGLEGYEGQHRAQQKLFNLLLKAVESSYLITQWSIPDDTQRR